MKKIMLMAAAAVMTLAANAQNPTGTKQVLAAKSYNEALNIVKAQEGTMTSAERAKAYNQLVTLALADYKDAEEKAVKAQLAKNEGEQASQQARSLEGAYNAILAAMDCNKADNEPNEKGQVKPKFQKGNQGRLITARNSMVNGGLTAYNNKDYASAKKYFGMFVDSRQNSLFEGYDFSQETNYNQLAYYAGLAAYFDKDYKKCVEYAKIGLNDPEQLNDALTLVLGAEEGLAKDGKVDTLTYINDVKGLYEKYPDNELLFGKLVGLYDESGDKDNANKMLNDRLAKDPNDVMALAYVGQNAQTESKWGEAIDAYTKAIAARPAFIQAKFNLAICYLNRGVETYDTKSDARGNMPADIKASVVSDITKAVEVLEQVKNDDPEQDQVRWKAQLDRAKYALEQLQ